ncbi:hypothetical protein CC80DRAFT_542469 [Byssothecium circinans]|uniref:Methyltransferase type 11 domain-containing protein n=1 Tax=Byssothecium circinans TaxID=147558 RepID=A0A6A5UB79_9PLEO|nr:hypothetical protein CC80DRAFT_542469 [Byssothecium circinans]
MATLIAADIFDPESELKLLDGKMDIIHTALFLHLFSEDMCVKAVRRILKLFKDKVGVLFIGKQLGCVDSGMIANGGFRYNAESFKEMWERVSAEAGMEWKVECWLGEEDLYEMAAKTGIRAHFLLEGSRWLSFSVRRIK